MQKSTVFKQIFKTALWITGFCLFATILQAAPNDMPTEISTIKTGTEGYIKGLCWLIGSGSAAVGTWKFVQTQSLQAATLAGAVTVLAFKFPAWVIAAATI
jgi:hypothetical protein